MQKLETGALIRHLPHLTAAERNRNGSAIIPKGQTTGRKKRENDFLKGATPQQNRNQKIIRRMEDVT